MVRSKAMMIAAAAESAPLVSGGGTAPVVSVVKAAPAVATGETAPVVATCKTAPKVSAGKNPVSVSAGKNPVSVAAGEKGSKVVAAGKKKVVAAGKKVQMWLQLVKQLVKKVLRLQLLEKKNVVAAGKKSTNVVAAGEEAPVVVVAAPVEAGGARPRRKGVKYNSLSKLDNKLDETATLCGERSVVVGKTSEVPRHNNKKRKANPVDATIIEDAEPTTKKAKKKYKGEGW